jgi:hypothetical protein
MRCAIDPVIVYVAKKYVLSFSVETPNVLTFPHHIILLFLSSEIINVCTQHYINYSAK